MSLRPSLAGLRHLALWAIHWQEMRAFYIGILGMRIDWEPDEDNVYLTSGQDNLALHRANFSDRDIGKQKLDHLGFFLHAREDVDHWFQYLITHNVEVKGKPKDHRDGTRSVYCQDPDGNIVQFIYVPNV